MFSGECWLAEAREGGRRVPWEGAGRERREPRNQPERGGWGGTNLALGLRRRGERGTLKAREAAWSGARQIMGQQEPALMN